MDEKNYQQGWSSQQNNQSGSLSPGESASQGGPIPPPPPPPPPPEITLRTMQSDIESIQQSGGEGVAPKPFSPAELKKEESITADDLSKEEGMIKPSGGEGIIPPLEQPKSKFKVLILITILVLIVAAIGYIGYIYIYPMFAKTAVFLPSILQTPETSTLSTTTTGETAVFPESEITPTGLEEIATTTEAVPPTPPILKPHLSYLTVAPELVKNFNLSAPVTLSAIRDLLTAEANNPPAEITSEETVLSDENGQLVFAELLPMFLPEFTAAELSPLFEEDFTNVIFYDQNGAWLGMIAKLKEGTSLETAKILMAKLEKSDNLPNLYLQNPGAKSTAGFKDGKANNQATRYLPFTKIGASLNYGWIKDNLFVLSASYNGIKAIFTNLGMQ